MEIIMDQHKQIKSIEDIQKAEEKARLVLEQAKKQRDRNVLDSREKAKRIIEEGEASANAVAEELLKKTDKELDSVRKKRLAEAHEDAKKLKGKKIGKEKLESLADKVIKEIMGA